jgi:hypothetical protein
MIELTCTLSTRKFTRLHRPNPTHANHAWRSLFIVISVFRDPEVIFSLNAPDQPLRTLKPG